METNSEVARTRFRELAKALNTISEWREGEVNEQSLVLVIMHGREQDGESETSKEALTCALQSFDRMATDAAMWISIIDGKLKVCEPQDGEMTLGITGAGRKMVESLPRN